MGLAAFLYRCPLCGHDPTVRRGSGAACEACGAAFSAATGGNILVREPGVDPRPIPARDLGEELDRLGGPMSAATDAEGRVRFGASAWASECVGMVAVRSKGEVVGFVESLGPARPGRLTVTDEALAYHPREGLPVVTPLEGIRAIQTSSAALQLDLEGHLVQFRFDGDSSRRWEALLRELVQRVYDRLGKGTITEFQPRIVAE